MSLYPPFPLFTLIGFLVHASAMLAIAIRLLGRRSSRAVTYLGLGIAAYGIDFALIIILFFLFPNTLLKTELFAFIASVLVPFASLFLVLSMSAVNPAREKIGWAIFFIGGVAVIYSYLGVLQELQSGSIQYSYVHPAYPVIITQSQGLGGFFGAGLIGLFFLYHAARSSLFVQKRAAVIGCAAFLEALSSFYWMSSTPEVYIITHIVGALGSALVWAGFFLIRTPGESV